MPKFVDDTTVSSNQPTSVEQPVVVQTTDPNFYEINGLPSRGQFYPEETKIFGRPMKILELKQLCNINSENADNIINSVLKRVIKGIDIDSVMSADKLFLIFWERANTYPNSGYTLKGKCSLCDKEFSYDLFIDKLDIKYLDESFTTDKLTVKLPNSGDVIRFEYPRVRDERTAENFKNSTKVMKDADSDVISQAVLIQTINDKEMNILEKYSYIANMIPYDYAFFVSYIEHYSFGIRPVVIAQCSECGGEQPMAITFLGSPDFFIPTVEFARSN